MSWIDIFLSDGDPHKVYGAGAREALSRMPRLRDLPYLWIAYWKAGLSLSDQIAFLLLDLVRARAYRKGFRDGERFPWPEEQP
jgi:hypothetical protein